MATLLNKSGGFEGRGWTTMGGQQRVSSFRGTSGLPAVEWLPCTHTCPIAIADHYVGNGNCGATTCAENTLLQRQFKLRVILSNIENVCYTESTYIHPVVVCHNESGSGRLARVRGKENVKIPRSLLIKDR